MAPDSPCGRPLLQWHGDGSWVHEHEPLHDDRDRRRRRDAVGHAGVVRARRPRWAALGLRPRRASLAQHRRAAARRDRDLRLPGGARAGAGAVPHRGRRRGPIRRRSLRSRGNPSRRGSPRGPPRTSPAMRATGSTGRRSSSAGSWVQATAGSRSPARGTAARTGSRARRRRARRAPPRPRRTR